MGAGASSADISDDNTTGKTGVHGIANVGDYYNQNYESVPKDELLKQLQSKYEACETDLSDDMRGKIMNKIETYYNENYEGLPKDELLKKLQSVYEGEIKGSAEASSTVSNSNCANSTESKEGDKPTKKEARRSFDGAPHKPIPVRQVAKPIQQHRKARTMYDPPEPILPRARRKPNIRNTGRRKSFTDDLDNAPIPKPKDPVNDTDNKNASQDSKSTIDVDHKKFETHDSWESSTHQPFCTICNMAFATDKALKLHVQFSQVHAINLDPEKAKREKEEKLKELEKIEDLKESKIEQKDGIHFSLIYNGCKLFWKTQNSVDLHIYRHMLINCIEIVAVDVHHQMHESRLYLKYDAIRNEINMEEVDIEVENEVKKITATDKFAKYNREDIQERRITLAIVSFILKRLNEKELKAPSQFIKVLKPPVEIDKTKEEEEEEENKKEEPIVEVNKNVEEKAKHTKPVKKEYVLHGSEPIHDKNLVKATGHISHGVLHPKDDPSILRGASHKDDRRRRHSKTEEEKPEPVKEEPEIEYEDKEIKQFWTSVEYIPFSTDKESPVIQDQIRKLHPVKIIIRRHTYEEEEIQSTIANVGNDLHTIEDNIIKAAHAEEEGQHLIEIEQKM